MSTRDNRSQYLKLNHKPCDPDFAVHVYITDDHPGTETIDALRAIGQHFYIFNAAYDPVAHHYVTDVLDHYTWPVVTITTGADLVAHWEGHRTEMHELIPALRAQHARDAA